MKNYVDKNQSNLVFLEVLEENLKAILSIRKHLVGTVQA